MSYSIAAICLGAAAGALSRWGLSLAFNTLYPALPPGTLLANLLGAYLMGLAMATASAWSSAAPLLQLMFVTGFLGSLTTFSSFSAEVVGLLQQARFGAAMAAIAAHTLGSLLMTLLGLGTVYGIRRWH